MPRRQQELKRFPVGANDSADVSLLPEARAAIMIGIGPVNPGVGSRVFWKKRVQLNASFAPSGNITGVFQYTGNTSADDKIIVVKNGAFYRCTISANAPTATVNALNFTSTQLVAITNSSGIAWSSTQRTRAVQIGSEMFFVHAGGVTPVRYDGTTIYRLGIVAPAAPTDGGNLAGGALIVGAAYKYAVTYEDASGRESSPSTELSVTMGAGGGRTINWIAPTDAQVNRVYLYRSEAGGSTLFRTVEAGFSIATTTYADNSVNDTTISLNTPAPLAGQNDPPAAASLIAIYKNRLALNKSGSPRMMQISNFEEYGAYSLLGAVYNANGQLLNPTDGITFDVLNEFGDEITALGHLGSVLGVWNRRTIGIFEGDTPAEYQFRIVHRIGCIAADSVQECGNATAFMAEDGIYALDYQSGFSITKLSEDYNVMFGSASILWDPPGTYPPTRNFGRQARAEAACAVFMQNRYVLATPPWTYVYDFEHNAGYLDTMTGMPYGDGSVSDGYRCMSKISADRQFEVALYSPGPSGAVGDLYVMSSYPLTQDNVGVAEPFTFTYMTRAFDGAGVHRSRLKRFKRIRVFGTIKPMEQANGTDTAAALLQGTVSLVLEGGQRTLPASGSWYFDNIQQVGTNFVGRNWSRIQVQGLIIEQELPPNATGRVGQVLIQGTTVNALLTVTDVILDYDPTGD